MTELEKFFTLLNDNITPEKASELNTTFGFEIGGEDGGKWLADLTKSEGPWVTKVDGELESDCTFITKNPNEN